MADTQVKNNTLNFIMDYESGQIDDEQTIVDGFQALIDSGLAWKLEGHYGRTATTLIEGGYCKDSR